MAGPAQQPMPAAAAFRVAFRYAMNGDLCYLSHRDELRMLRRALMRAGWPLRFSRGYNPMPWLSVPLPRRVGLHSDCQLALTELSEPRAAGELRSALAAALPEACRLGMVAAPVAPGTPHPVAAEYDVALSEQAAGVVAPAAARWLEPGLRAAGDSRNNEDSAHMPKCQQYLERVVLDGTELRLRLRFVDQRTARPSEILTELGLAPDVDACTVRLREVAWNMEFAGPEMDSRASKGIAIGHEEINVESHESQND
jgi:radical SAM-linked protein